MLRYLRGVTMLEKIKKAIPYDIDKITKTNKGLTNDNYIITIDKKKYIMRYPIEDIKHLFNAKQEKQVIDKVSGQDYVLPVKYYHNGIQIVGYIDHLLTFEQISNPNRIKKVADLMKKFHNSELKVDFDFDPLAQIELYNDNIKNLKIDLNDYQELFNNLKAHSFKPVLCHNDWVAGNICFIGDKTYLIDFEYAGNNDPRFDIMSFLTENDLTKEERLEFLDLMFPNGISKKDNKALKMFRDTNNLLWYLWATMMHEFRNEDIYLSIANTKYKQLINDYKQDLWI